MWTKHHKKRKLGRFVMPLITTAFLAYFGYHSIHGDYGLKATEVFDRQKIERELQLKKLTAQRETLEQEVALLSDGSLERDMLDEKARFGLNMTRSDEIVIFH